MESGMDISSISKFRGENYHQWKFLIKSVLQAKGCDDTVFGVENTEDGKFNKKQDGYAKFLILSSLDLEIITLVDSCETDRRSYTGYVFLLARCDMTWRSQKQKTVALSSTESEYMSLVEACKESIYLNGILKELGFEKFTGEVLYNDNLSAHKLAENPVFHNKTKHIDVKHHFLRDAVKDSKVIIKYCESENMLADGLTKSLGETKFVNFVNMLGVLA